MQDNLIITTHNNAINQNIEEIEQEENEGSNPAVLPSNSSNAVITIQNLATSNSDEQTASNNKLTFAKRFFSFFNTCLPESLRPKYRFGLESFALAFVGIGGSLIGAANFPSDISISLPLLGIGVAFTGIGILPRLGLWMLEVHDNIEKEINLKEDIK